MAYRWSKLKSGELVGLDELNNVIRLNAVDEVAFDFIETALLERVKLEPIPAIWLQITSQKTQGRIHKGLIVPSIQDELSSRKLCFQITVPAEAFITPKEAERQHRRFLATEQRVAVGRPGPLHRNEVIHLHQQLTERGL
jgi:hypothetical protein